MPYKWGDMRRKLTTNALFQPKKSLFNILLLVWTEMESMTHVQGVNEIQGVFPHVAMRYSSTLLWLLLDWEEGRAVLSWSSGSTKRRFSSFTEK